MTSVRCRGSIRQTFVLAVLRSQIKVFGHSRGLGQASSSDMAAPHKFHFSRLKVSVSKVVVSTGGSEPATCEAEAPTSVMGDCEFHRTCGVNGDTSDEICHGVGERQLMVLVRCT